MLAFTAPIANATVGVRISEHLSVFSEYGRYRDANGSSLQPQVDLAVSQLAGRRIQVTGEGRRPAYYVAGGLRFDLATLRGVRPYVLAGAGWSRMTPAARFSYVAGSPTVSGRTAGSGENATDDVLSSGIYLGEVSDTLMLRWGAGLLIPVGRLLSVDVGYVGSRAGAAEPKVMEGLMTGVSFHF
jgi:opacity protein-like surface antigen